MTKKNTPFAKNVRTLTWFADGRPVQHSNLRHFGITDGEGHWLTFNGVDPYIVIGKATATEVAETMDPADMQWVTVRTS